MGVHYVSDIVVGAILGILVGWVGLQLTGLLLNWLSQFPIALF
jgi:membrane-associated phospholipid phosphatase